MKLSKFKDKEILRSQKKEAYRVKVVKEKIEKKKKQARIVYSPE